MANSIRQFDIEICEQHLEEASFLYEQRLAYLVDPELTWKELDEFEERFEAHIDALVVGADLALEVCKAHCSSGDFGELHAAMRVFCRQDRSDLTYTVLQNLDVEDPDTVQAVIDALKAECPDAWHDDLVRILLGKCSHLVPAIAPVLGYRRVPVEDTLVRAIGNADSAGLPNLVWALGRVGDEPARAAIGPHLRSDDEAVAEAACRALIRLGDYHAIRHGLLVAQAKPWPTCALGIGGNHTAVNVLSDVVRSDNVSDDALIALGMLGDLGSVVHIYNCLMNPERAMAAAVALQTITGAALYEEVFVPDEIDPDELFDEEREKYEQTGEVPTRPDGQPYGENVIQISVNPQTWREWLDHHKQNFDTKLRYRHGQPASPAASLQCLAAEHTPGPVRALVLDEFAVRYGVNFRMEADMPVREQETQLTVVADWVRENQSRFTAGQWYFAGRPMEQAQ